MKKFIALAMLLLSILTINGCSANQMTEGGRMVKLSHEKPMGDCQELGEVIGAQGNWFTGPYTPNKNLVQGASNDMRNQAYTMGGTDVWVHQQSAATGNNANTVNAFSVGTVYKCLKQLSDQSAPAQKR